ncbi:MAG TPA: glycosyltransferase family 4 protein, partial [Myxococcaceae bacterium]|nr:glycosyltransferase family 4 protein [Myxococcaceae bacterium]
ADRLEGVGVRLRRVEPLLASPIQAVRTWSAYDVLQLNYFSPTSKAALLAYAALPARIVYVDHSSGEPNPHGRVRRSMESPLRSIWAMRISMVVGVSEFVRERDRRRYNLAAQKARTIHNGVDLNRFTPNPFRAPEGPLRILGVAYLIHEKGMDLLLRAFAQLRGVDTRLDIVGDGPERDALESLAHKLGVADRVRFLGLRNDVQDLVATADIFVHPARWAEAFGLTITEAMAAGVPVIASRIGGIPEIIEHTRSGLLFRPDDADDLARQLRELSSNSDRRVELGARGRERVKLKFDLQRSADEHLRALEEACGLSPHPQLSRGRAGLGP